MLCVQTVDYFRAIVDDVRTPAANGTLETSPVTITLLFAQPVGPSPRVVMTCGDPAVTQSLANPVLIADQVTVQVDVLASATSTVVEVYADDEVGRFAHLAMLLTDAGVDVVAARATTIGDRIVDTFYVRDATGKIVDPATIARIRAAIARGLDGDAPEDESARP